MDIQRKIDRISALIEQLPEGKQRESHFVLSKEFAVMSEDVSLPKSLRDLCLDLSMLANGNDAGPLGTIPKKRIKEIFLAMKVNA